MCLPVLLLPYARDLCSGLLEIKGVICVDNGSEETLNLYVPNNLTFNIENKFGRTTRRKSTIVI